MGYQVWQLADHEYIVSNELPVDRDGSTGRGSGDVVGSRLFHKLLFPWRGVVIRPEAAACDDEDKENDDGDEAAKNGTKGDE